MGLKRKFATVAEIPAELVKHCVERDGAWHLDIEGSDEAARLAEMRKNNLGLLEQLKRFEGIDPDEVRKLAEEKRRLEEAAQIKAGEGEKVYDARLKAARSEWEKQHGPVVVELNAMKAQLSAIQIDQAVVNEATKRGLRRTALLDVTARARNAFKLVGGVPRAFDGDGETPRVGKDGVSPMTLAEWVEALVADAPHLFESNSGGGAAGTGAGGAGSGTVKNPWRKDTWNVTEQMKLERTDPQQAARLETAA